MASLTGFRFDITGASGSQGALSPRNGWKAYVFPRGAYASQDSTGTLVTFDSADAASRFAANDWIQAGLLTANIRQVAAVGGNSLSVSGAALTIAENDRIYLIGSTEPTVTGGSATYVVPNTVIRQRDDDAADAYTNSMITADSNGMVQGFAAPAFYDILVQDGNRANQGSLVDVEVGVINGISVSDWAHFGSTVTMHAALGVTGTIVGLSTISIFTGNTEQVRFSSDNGTSPPGNINRFGEAALWSSGSDNAPYKTWASADQALVFSRVHLQDGAANEQYNVSTRTNFKGNWTAPQSSIIHETQWHSVDGASCQNMFGEQSVARISCIGTGGTAPTMTLIAAIRGDVKISNSATGTVADATGVQGVGPNKVGGWTGTITRGSGVMARTGDGASVNYAIQIEQGGGIAALQALNTFTLSSHPGITTQLFHNQFATKFTGGITTTSFAMRYFDISPRIEFTLNGGTFDANVMTTLHISPEFNAADTIPNFNGIRINMRNIAGGTMTACYGVDMVSPTRSAGTISRYSHIRLQAPTGTTNSFHLSFGAVSTATPATYLASLTATAGDTIFLTDSDNADNSGLYLYMNGAWYGWTPGGVAAASDT